MDVGNLTAALGSLKSIGQLMQGALEGGDGPAVAALEAFAQSRLLCSRLLTEQPGEFFHAIAAAAPKCSKPDVAMCALQIR